MNNKVLGALALAGAPFLFIGFFLEFTNKQLENSWFTGFWGFIYITAWMCSIVALQKVKATGDGWFGRSIFWIILISLTVANVSNIYQWAVPENKPSFFFYIDLFWPLSNLLMMVVGITVLVAKKLNGWKRFIPLVVGLWLPIALGFMFVMGKTPLSMIIGGVYSLIAWTLLAIMVRSLPENLVIANNK
jgi:hypothetical protein